MHVELGNPRIDVAVADVDIAVRVPGDIGRLAEQAVDRRQRWIDVLPWPGIVSGFLAAAEHPLDAAGWIELDDHVRALVDGPDIVVLVDAHAMSEGPGVEALADLADEIALGSEF